MSTSSSRRRSSLSAVSHAVSLSVHRRFASLRVVPEDPEGAVQTLEPSSSDFFEVGGHAALPARNVLDALNERCRRRGIADAELDGALSSHGGFLPLAWAEEVLEFGWVNLHDEIEERVKIGTRVTHDVHGNGHVVGFGQKRDMLVEFESEKNSLHSYTAHTIEHLKFPGAIFKTECTGLVTPHVGGGHARLPESHASWEEAASAMPSAYREGSFGKLVSSLPPLSFAAAELPSKFLPRAAALLALLCHGCHYFGGMDLPPPHVMEAWREVTRRLDRPMPMMHINDLVLHNWQLNEAGRACAQPALVAALALDQRPEVAALVSKECHAEASDDNAPPRTVWSEAGLGGFDAVDRLKVLIPVFGGRESGCLTEDVFLCTITVMHMVTAPLVELCVACQEAAMRDQPERVAQLLTHIKACIDAATRAFLRIDPMSSSSTYCDQIEWARTVGTIPVPILPDAQAASGLEMPLFHLCDVFLGRALFHSVYGKQMLEERAKNLPRNHREFLAAIEKISVRAYISSKASASLAARWNATVESFAGERGLLGVHALKASGYLEVAVKVGRVQMNATTCNESDWRARQWLTPIEHLHESRNERYTGKISADQGQIGSFAKAEIVAVGDAAATAVSPEERQPRGCPFSSSRAGSGSWRCPFGYTRNNVQAVGQDRAGHLKVDISLAGLQYDAGDIVSLAGKNSDKEIVNLLHAMHFHMSTACREAHKQMSGQSQATLDAAMLSSARRLLLVPDDLWKKHAEELSIPLENGCFLCLYVMLQNAQITALPYSVLETFAAVCPHVKAGTSLHRRILNSGKVSASLADLFDIAFEPPYHTLRDGGAWLLYGPVCDVLKPLAARNYSIASAPDGIWPSQLDLCIGRQQWLVELPPRLQKLHQPQRTVSRLRSSRFVEESSKLNYKQTPISRDLSQLASKQIKRVGVLTHSLLDAPFPHNGRKPVMLRIEPSHRFHLPTDPSVPLLLFAAGTGVAPFRGFLSARLSLEHAGKITLFYSLRDVAAAPFIRELQDLANSSAGRFKLHLCVSQSRLPSVVPANVMVHPGHVDGVIQAEEEQIWRALSGDSSSSAAEQPGKEGEQNTVTAFQESERGVESNSATPSSSITKSHSHSSPGAAVYVCGMAPYGRTVERSLRQVVESKLTEGQNFLNFWIDLVTKGRYAMHVFGGGRAKNERVWLTTDVALRNGGSTGLDEAWWIYEEAVYDISLYAHMHPGGSKLILDKAGRDATSEFRTAHSANIKEFVALMEVYRVGSLAPPPPATDTIIWTQLVQLLHFATEIVNVVRGEAQVLLRVQTMRSGITQPPQHEQLVAYQKIVHRGGYVDRLVLAIADVMKAIAGACPVQLRPRFLAAANRARQWSSESNDSIALEEIGESPDVNARPSDARERVLAHRSAAGKHNFDPTGHALGEELLNTARAGLENVRKELILMLQQIEEQGSLKEYSAVPEAPVGEMLLGHLQSSFDLCVALYTKVALALT